MESRILDCEKREWIELALDRAQ